MTDKNLSHASWNVAQYLKNTLTSLPSLRAVTRLVTTACKLYTNDIDNNEHKYNILFPMPDRKAYAEVLLKDILETIDE